jgi:hypothetical protein
VRERLGELRREAAELDSLCNSLGWSRSQELGAALGVVVGVEALLSVPRLALVLGHGETVAARAGDQ